MKRLEKHVCSHFLNVCKVGFRVGGARCSSKWKNMPKHSKTDNFVLYLRLLSYVFPLFFDNSASILFCPHIRPCFFKPVLPQVIQHSQTRRRTRSFVMGAQTRPTTERYLEWTCMAIPPCKPTASFKTRKTELLTTLANHP